MTATAVVKEVPPTMFVVSTHDGVTIPEIPAIARAEVDQMLAALEEAGGVPTSPVTFIYHGADGTHDTKFRLTLAVPIATAPPRAPEPYEVFRSEPFRCVATDFIGAMPDIQVGYDHLFAAIEEQGLAFTGESREIYKKWVGYESEDNVTELQLGVV